MADPTGKAARVARSRQACSACRLTKQRCDGPSRIPCRRCELYGLQCEYPPSSGPSASKPAVARPTPPPYVPQPGTTGITGGEALMAEKLREISERLRSIESSLEGVHLSPNNQPRDSQDSVSRSPHSTSLLPIVPQSPDDSSSSSQSGQGADAGHLSGAPASNPLQTVISQISMIEAVTTDKSLPSSPQDWASAASGSLSSLNATMQRLFAGVSVADVITRNIMSTQECEASFRLFFSKIAPWIMNFDDIRDSNASALRERSPFLFHVMLLTSSYYLMESSDRGSHIYYSLTALVNELVAPLIVSPQPHQVTPDFVRAISVLLVYKPVQFAALYSAHVTDPDIAEQSCKLNTFSSSTLGGLMSRTALAIHLSSTPSEFSKNFNPSIAIAPQTLSNLRLWYWLLVVDTHGALSTGRATSLNMSDALRTTRLFSSLKTQTSDVRLAAMVELYSTARTAMGGIWTTGSRTITAVDLKKFNKDIDEWEAYWTDALIEAGAAGDQLAHTVTIIFASFVRITLNTSIYTRWRTEQQQSLSRGGNGRPELSDDDWHFLQIGVTAAERLIYCLSMESRVNGNPFRREVNWSSKVTGPRPALKLDPVMVDIHRTALDPITCVVYIFSLIVIAKIANSGLILCELKTQEDEYEAGNSGSRPQRLVVGAKLGRLLELGASFLEATAPTRSHPAKKHARMLRAILVAGTSGQPAPISPTAAYTHLDGPVADVAATLRDMSRGRPHPAASQNRSGLSPTGYVVPPPSAYSHQPVPPPRKMSQDEPGEALAAILGGLSPAWFGQLEYFDNGGQGQAGQVGNGLDATMSVDWDSLEKSMDLQRAQDPFKPPGGNLYYSARSHP